MSGELFPDVPRVEPPEPARDPAAGLSADRRRTFRQRADLQAGRHPLMGGPTHPDVGTCGNCAHHVVIQMGSRYHKCELKHSASAATDVRVGWPACQRWAAT